MFSSEAHYLVLKEQHKDLQRDAARHQLIKTALLGQSNNRKPGRRMAGWFGFQLVKWGSKLQRYNQARHHTVIQHGS